LNISILNYSNYCDKLYEDATKMKNKKVNLSKEMYKDITFKPKTNSDLNSIIVNSTFEERSNKLLQLKSELQNRLKELENEEMKNKKVPTKKEVETNNKNVVDRLYQKEIDKIREKNEKNEGEKENVLKKLKNQHKIRFKDYKERVLANNGTDFENEQRESQNSLRIFDEKNDTIINNSEKKLKNNHENSNIDRSKSNSENSNTIVKEIEVGDSTNSEKSSFKSKTLQNLIRNRILDTPTPLKHEQD
jgi:hypothetical protein